MKQEQVPDSITVKLVLELLKKKIINKETVLGVAYDERPEGTHRYVSFAQWHFDLDRNALEMRPIIGLTIDYKDACRELSKAIVRLEQENEELTKLTQKPARKPRAPRKPRSAKK